ncbi:hypothetical protein C5167_000345 [Papaver somniferum]|uniref:Protein YIP n=1 Tax=Papaver somniferum TaxID=3469 RepID=A0A4Y7KV53_PAPSO|nr:hypothetical protein C5167_000345 [Papaver somniferum]
MAKEFNVPPVVFPSGGNPGNSLNHRRTPVAPFTPPKNPNLPFMSFDIGVAASSSSFSAPPIGIGNGSFDDELPLLEELGINTRQIWRKTVSIMNPFRVDSNLYEDSDLSGWVSVASLFLYVVFNMLAGKNGNLDLYRCLSLLGYCMFPIVILSAFSLFIPQGWNGIFVITGVFVLWSTRVCTRLLVELASCGDEHKGLIAYACFLIYMLFSFLKKVHLKWEKANRMSILIIRGDIHDVIQGGIPVKEKTTELMEVIEWTPQTPAATIGRRLPQTLLQPICQVSKPSYYHIIEDSISENSISDAQQNQLVIQRSKKRLRLAQQEWRQKESSGEPNTKPSTVIIFDQSTT